MRVSEKGKNKMTSIAIDGYEGSRYTPSMTTAEIAKEVRRYCRAKYPRCKFSVRTKYFSGGSDIRVSLMAGPFQPFEDKNLKYAQLNYYALFGGWEQYNNYNGGKLTPQAWEVLHNVTKYLFSFHEDNSDPQTDYFDVNFYPFIEIGQWDKPFKEVVL